MAKSARFASEQDRLGYFFSVAIAIAFVAVGLVYLISGLMDGHIFLGVTVLAINVAIAVVVYIEMALGFVQWVTIKGSPMRT